MCHPAFVQYIDYLFFGNIAKGPHHGFSWKSNGEVAFKPLCF